MHRFDLDGPQRVYDQLLVDFLWRTIAEHGVKERCLYEVLSSDYALDRSDHPLIVDL